MNNDQVQNSAKKEFQAFRPEGNEYSGIVVRRISNGEEYPTKFFDVKNAKLEIDVKHQELGDFVNFPHSDDIDWSATALQLEPLA